MIKLCGTDVYAEFLLDKKSEKKQDALLGCLLEDVVAKSQDHHPEYDIDYIADITMDYLEKVVRNDNLKYWELSYGMLTAAIREKVELLYNNRMKNRPRIVALDEARHISYDDHMQEEICHKVSLDEVIKILQQKTKHISERDKRILHLKYVGKDGKGMSYAEIARELGVSPERVRQKLDQIQKNIRKVAIRTDVWPKINSLLD